MAYPTAYQRDKMIARMLAGTSLEQTIASYVDIGASTFPIPITPPGPVIPPIVIPPLPAPGPGTLLLQDKMAYKDEAEFRIAATIGTGLYSDGPHHGNAHFDPSMKFNGHGTIRYDQDIVTPQLWTYLKQPTDRVWIKFTTYFPSTWSSLGTPLTGAESCKLFAADYVGGGSTRIEVKKGVVQCYTDWFPVAGGPITFIYQPTATMPVDKWVDHIIFVDQPNKTVRYWRQDAGTVPTLDCTLVLPTVPPKVSFVQFGLNYNQLPIPSAPDPRNGRQAYWLGEWEVWTGGNPFNIVGG